MCTTVGFDANFYSERTPVMNLLPEIVKKKKQTCSRLADSSRAFLSRFTNNKCQLSFVMPTGLPGEAIESIAGTAQS